MHVRAPAGRRPAPGKFLYIQIQSHQFDGRSITVDPFVVEFTENCILLGIAKPGQRYTSDPWNLPRGRPHPSAPVSRPSTRDRVADFSASEGDELDFSSFGYASARALLADAVQKGEHVKFALDIGDTVILSNVDLNTLRENQDLFLI